MREYLQELLQRVDNRYSIDTKDMSLGDWICQNTHLRSKPFSFDRYPFQKAIADDLHPNMDVIKPSQVGLSEVQVRKALAFITRNRHTNLIFTLPNDDMYERMSSTRILPLVKEEKVFNLEGTTTDKPVRSKGLIQIGSSFMFVTGAKEGDATSISADVVFNDEIDLTDQQMLALFNSRLQNSDWKISQRFSTPTFVGFGVDSGYQVSDQHEYLCKCSACNHHNIPVFTERFIDLPGLPSDVPLTEIDEKLIDTGRLDLINAQVVCEKCRAPLDLGNTSAREWVAKYASRTHARGYRVRPFSTDRLKVDYIITQMLRYRQRDYMRGWYNTVLGEAFTDENARLTDAQINQCFTARSHVPDVDKNLPTWIGIDVGKTCHIIVSQGETMNNQHVVVFKTVLAENLIKEVQDLLDTYNVIGGACDRHPYTPTANELCEISRGKILPVEYRGQKDVNLIKDPVTEEVIYAQVNRTKVIDEFVRMVRKVYIRFSGYGTKKSIITEHLKDMVRDETPEKPATWVKLKGNDHYFHAGAFLAAAMMIKELQYDLTAEKRGSVAVIGVNMASDGNDPFKVSPKRDLAFGRI